MNSSRTKNRILDIIDKLKSGIIHMLGANVINKAVGFVSTMIITRLLTQDEYGLLGYTFNLYSYLQILTGFGLITGALQFGTENYGTKEAYGYFKYCLRIGVLIDAGLVLVIGCIVSVYRLPIEGAKPYVITMLPILILEFISLLGQVILRAQNRIQEYARSLNINTVATAVGTCVGAFFGVIGVLVGRYLAIIVTLVCEMIMIRPCLVEIFTAKKITHIMKKRLWKYSLFTGASSALNSMVYALDVTLIAALLHNTYEIGVYRVGTLIPNALQFIPSSVVTALLPTIIYHRKDISWVRNNLKKMYCGLAVCNAFLCATIIVFARFIISITAGDKYLASVPVLRILAFGYFFSGTFRVLSTNLLAAFKRVHYGLFISISSCASDALLNYVCISNIGMIGAAYATLFVDIFTAALGFGYILVLVIRGTINVNN